MSELTNALDHQMPGVRMSASQLCRKYKSDSKKLLESPEVRDYIFFLYIFPPTFCLEKFQTCQKVKIKMVQLTPIHSSLRSNNCNSWCICLYLPTPCLPFFFSFSIYVFLKVSCKHQKITSLNSSHASSKNKNIHLHNHNTITTIQEN